MEEKIQGIRFRTIIEMLGKPKEHIEKTLRDFVERIREDSEYILAKENYAESVPRENLWSTYAELEVVTKDISRIMAFCFEYMPSSVEILMPQNFTIENHVVTGMLNDLQGRLHNVDMIIKRLRAENDLLKRNMKISIENLITILLKLNAMSFDELSTYTGINRDELSAFLSVLIKDSKIKLDNEKYVLVKNE